MYVLIRFSLELYSSGHHEHSRTTSKPALGRTRGRELSEGLALLDLRPCRARRDAVHSRRRADPVRPLPTARLGICEGSHQGLTWRASGCTPRLRFFFGG